MAYTLSSPETVTKTALEITSQQISFAGAQSAATVSYCYVDQNGNQIPGSQASLTIPPADFISLWNAGMTLAAIESYVAGKIGLSSGTAAGDGTLH